MSIGTAENEETLSTMSMVSGKDFTTLADAGEVVDHAGGGFDVDEGDGVEAAFRELGADGFRDRSPRPTRLARLLGLEAAFFGDVEPFVGKRAAAEAEHFLFARGCAARLPSRPRRRRWRGKRDGRCRRFPEGRAGSRRRVPRNPAAVADHGLRMAAKVSFETSTGPGVKSLGDGMVWMKLEVIG